MGLIVNKIIGTGRMLPKKASMVAWIGDIPKAIPTGIAPFTSTMGSAAVSNTLNSFSISIYVSVLHCESLNVFYHNFILCTRSLFNNLYIPSAIPCFWVNREQVPTYHELCQG